MISVVSSEAIHCRSNVSTSRAITPYTTSTESEPNNMSFSQNSPPSVNMKMSSEDDAVLTITVPFSEKGLSSYDSPNMDASSTNGQRRRYGDYEQSTSSSTEPSVSLDEEAALSARRRVRPLLRSKQIITEGSFVWFLVCCPALNHKLQLRLPYSYGFNNKRRNGFPDERINFSQSEKRSIPCRGSQDSRYNVWGGRGVNRRDSLVKPRTCKPLSRRTRFTAPGCSWFLKIFLDLFF